MTNYFSSNDLIKKGLPTVGYVGEMLNVSPKYLSSVLRIHTGQSALQHIHDKLIEKAKEQLSVTQLSVGEIAYALGFEHPQSFSKFFKSKTKVSPLGFRQSLGIIRPCVNYKALSWKISTAIFIFESIHTKGSTIPDQ